MRMPLDWLRHKAAVYASADVRDEVRGEWGQIRYNFGYINTANL